MAQITKISIGQSTKFAFLFYLVLVAVIMLPMMLFIGTMIGSQGHGVGAFAGLGMGVLFLVAVPFYAMMGAVFVAIGSFVYNLVASWVGGIEVEVSETRKKK